MTHHRRGFTLVELLVSLGIITVSLAILLPAVLQARRQALSTQCLSNLRQVALGFRLSADANGGRMPKPEQTSRNGEPWFIQIAPYLELSEGVFQCPANPEPESVNPGYAWRDDARLVPETAVGGKRFDSLAQDTIVLVYDAEDSWHHEGARNIAFVSGTAQPMPNDEFEENRLLNVETGELFFLRGS